MSDNQIHKQGTDAIGKLLIRFSLPAIIGTLSFALYGVVDMMFVGRIVGEQAIAALNLTMPLFNIILALGMLISTGSATILSIKLGEKNIKMGEKIIGNAFSLLLITAIILSIFSFIFLEPILRLFAASATTLPLALSYMRIILIGLVFNFLAYGMNAIIRSEGNAKFAMLIMISGSICNIILDPIFIYVLNWGIEGAAIATVIANLLTACLVGYYYISGKSSLKLRPRNLIPSWKIFLTIFPIGLAPFLMQSASSIVMMLMNRKLKYYGDDLGVAVGGVVSIIIMFVLFPVIGISQGTQPIIGYNYGAKQFARVKQTLLLATFAASTICISGEIFIYAYPDFILKLFSKSGSNPNFIKAGIMALRIVATMLWGIGFQMIGASFFQAINRPRIAILLSLLRQVIILIPLLIIIPHYYGLQGVWIAWPISDAISIIIAGIFLVREFRKIQKQIEVK